MKSKPEVHVRTITRQTQVSARWAFWGFMFAVALTAVTVSIATLPWHLLWIAFAGVVASGMKLGIAIVRMPQGSRTLWSLIGAWGLLVAVLSLTV